MNELLIPPATNWYQFNQFECAPDNTIVYGCRRDIYIINPRDPSEAADIQCIVHAHGEKITGLSINHAHWGDPDKLAASISEDKVVRLWDLKTLSQRQFHKEYEKINEPLVGVSLVGDRVVTVSEKGVIVVWRLSSNSVTKISNIFPVKVRVRCMLSCPHAIWCTAFGLTGGLIIVADLRKGKVLHKMRGNEHDVTGLSWCPTPFNIYKTTAGIQIDNMMKQRISWKKVDETQNVENGEPVFTKVSNLDLDAEEYEVAENTESKQEDLENSEQITKPAADIAGTYNTSENLEVQLSELNLNYDNDDILEVDIPNYNMDDRKTQKYQKIDKKNPWGDVKFDDCDNITLDDSKETPKSDFLKECLSLRTMIASKDIAASGSESTLGRRIMKARCKKTFEQENKENIEDEEVQFTDLKDKVEHKFKLLTENFDNVNEPGHSENRADSLDNNSDTLQLETVEKHETVNLVEDTEQRIEGSDIVDTPHSPKSEVPVKRFVSENCEKEYLLASVGKDGHVSIWRALTDGRQQMFLPSPGKAKKTRESYRNKWAAVCWAKPDILIVTSINRLYCWNLLPTLSDKSVSAQALIEPRLVHQDHSNQIFNISVPYKIYPEIERTISWHSLHNFFVWSTGKDKWILCTTLGTQRKTLVSYPCFSSGVNCMAVSPIDPTKLALGLFDNSIRIWDLSFPQIQAITMTKLVDNIQDKIICLDWHPVKENYLAYGTVDGRVAQFMINSKARTSFCQYHKYSVHKVQFGPLPGKEGHYALYSCAGGNLIYHDDSHPSADPEVINLDECRPQTFEWNSDYSILAVGSKDGSVKLSSRNFEVYETFYMQKKAVQCVCWHPQSTVADSGKSPYVNYLAVSTNDSNVFVYNCQSYEESAKKSTLVAVLEGHNCSVKWLAWCPQISGRLVTGSEDSVVMVWNVISQTLLSSFKWENKDNLGSLIWSPVDADLIIIGGKDHTLKIFRITKHPPVMYEPDIKKNSSRSSLKVVHENDDNDNDNVVSSIPQEKTKKLFILPAITKCQNPEFTDSIAICRRIMEISDDVSIKNSVDSENGSSDEESAAKSDVESAVNFKIEPAQLFGTRKDMINILNYEQNLHIRKHNWEGLHNISLWRGDLAKSIEQALKTGVVEPWIINMAPMVSHSLWMKLCLLYAEKLVEDNQGLEASSYFLACHQVHKAINALCNSNFYREAVALAKCRLPPEDPVIDSVYERWASYGIHTGNYEVAAQCYIKLGRYSDAGVLLNKRAEPDKLELALELAKRSNNHDLEVAVNAKLELISQQKHQITNQVQDTTEIDSKYPIIKISQSRFEALMGALNKKTDEDDITETIIEEDVNLENNERKNEMAEAIEHSEKLHLLSSFTAVVIFLVLFCSIFCVLIPLIFLKISNI